MAQRRRGAEFGDEEAEGDGLWRLLAWAGWAGLAVGIAFLAARSDRGTERLTQARSGLMGFAAAIVPSAPPREAESPRETRRLREALRSVTADRDRLLARLHEVERAAGATGSLPRETPPAVGSAPPEQPRSGSLAPAGAAPPEAQPATGRIVEDFAAAVDPAAMNSTATATQFGIDVGGGQNVEILRALWGALRDAYSKHLAGLRPVVAVREGGKSGGGLELRLIAGPLANAVAAARLCATLTAAGLLCQPALFDGQQLAAR